MKYRYLIIISLFTMYVSYPAISWATMDGQPGEQFESTTDNQSGTFMLSMMSPANIPPANTEDMRKDVRSKKSASTTKGEGECPLTGDNDETNIPIRYQLADLQEIINSACNEMLQYEKEKDKLEITENQVNSLHKLAIEFRKKQIQNDAEIKILQLDIKELIREGTDLNKLENLLGQLTNLNKKINDQILEFFKTYYSVVNKEQRSQLKAIMKK
jgi:hypothetical protein